MGPLDDHELRIAYYEQQLATWEAERRELVAAIAEAEAGTATTPQLPARPLPFRLDDGEHVFHVLEGAGLVEDGCDLDASPRRPFCLRVTRDLRWNLRTRRGGLLSPVVPDVIDRGTVWITDRRVVFAGESRQREWAFPAISDVEHLTTAPVTVLQVEGRHAAMGISYDAYTAGAFRLRLAIALAHAAGTSDRLVKDLRAELADHEERRPSPPSATSRAIEHRPPHRSTRVR
jgi:hypothetical protein